MKNLILSLAFVMISMSMFGQEVEKRHNYIVEIGAGVGTGSFNDDFIKTKAHFIYNYQCNPYIAFGGGIGLDLYLIDTSLALPFFANINFTYPSGKVSPFTAFTLGYSFYVDDPIDYLGLYLVPSFGIEIKNNKVSWLISASYDTQWIGRSAYISYKADSGAIYFPRIGAFMINAGIKF